MKKLIIGIGILSTLFCGSTAFASEPPSSQDTNSSQLRVAGGTYDITSEEPYSLSYYESDESQDSENQTEAINAVSKLKESLEKCGFSVAGVNNSIPYFRLMKYTGTQENVQVPACITTISDRAFENCNNIKSIVLPERSICKIGNYAFKDCTSLEEINIPSTIRIMGICAFMNCKSLKSINIPGSISDIRKGSFLGCELLSDITLNEGSTIIWDHAFAGCSNLKFIELPSSVNEIHTGAFNGCRKLENVKFNGCFEIRKGEFVYYGCIGNLAFYNCDSLKEVNFSEKIRYESDSFPCGCIVNGKKLSIDLEKLQSMREEARKIREKMLNILKKFEEDGYDLTEYKPEIARFGDSEDGIAKLLNKYDRYSALPKVVDDEDFDTLSEGKPVLYRGLGDRNGRTGADFANEFRYGSFFNGRGNQGNGTYTTTDLETAFTYAYAWGDRSQKERNIGLLKMILDDSANVIDYNVLDEISRLYKNDDLQYLKWIYSNEDKPWIYLVDYDLGNLAEVAGYDAIHYHCGAEDFYIILNRGKVIVSRENATR